MYKKTITYTDYNGVERTEDHWFNMTTAELTKLELGKAGGFSNSLERITKALDGPSLIKEFENIIDKSYGVKSDDGKRFIKSEQILNDFKQTEAYSQLFMELLSDDEEGSKFINGIIPNKLAEQVQEQLKEQGAPKIETKAS